MIHNNLFLFNLPNNFACETTIAQKKRKHEENLKNWQWEDVIAIDDNDVPNDLVETGTMLKWKRNMSLSLPQIMSFSQINI